MTPEKLLEAGYKEFESYLHKNADRAFQKRFRDGKDTKYFITIYWYDTTEYVGKKDESFEVSLQFYKMYRGKEITMNVTLFSLFDYMQETKSKEFFDIGFVEDYVEKFFRLNEFKYYEKY